MRTSSNQPTRRTVPVLHPRKLTAFMLVCAFLFSAIAWALPAAAEEPEKPAVSRDILLTVSPQYAAAKADTITEAEAEALIDQSYLALARIHKNTEHWWSHTPGLEKIPSEYNTVEKMSAYFHSLFSDEIADGLWMYAAEESADKRPVDDYYPEHMESGKVSIYQVNSNGLLEIADYYSQLDFGIGVVWNSDWGTLLNMPKIQNITGDAEHAEALAVMSDFGWDGPPSVGVVQVKFIKEPDGWKVSDSDFIDLVLQRDRSGFRIHLEEKYTGGAREMLYELLGEGYTGHSYDVGTALIQAATYQFLSFDDQGMKLIYHLKNRETGETDSYSAEFVIVPPTQEKPYSTWQLVDGTLMQLLGWESPATGDDTPRTVLLCSAAMLLSAMGAHAVLKMRKD